MKRHNMKVIILAAGQGTRLRPLTNDKPKCMVELNGKPLIKHQLDLFSQFGIKDINIVTGYLEDKIDFQSVKKFYNPKFDSTNMVSTLFCASELFDGVDDILISYGDIVYKDSVLNAIEQSNAQINVVVDKNWREYWEARMEDPLSDVETLKIDNNGYIKELGKKPNSYNDIEGQYIGLIKIRKDVVKQVKDYYQNLDKNILYDGKNYNNMYMTSFLQMISDNIIPLTPVFITSGWIEVDEPSDLNFGYLLNN
jgi:L-glutamine-phosphate cytidylyltransferase